MCGRTRLSLLKEKVQCACSYKSKDDNFYTKPDWLPEFNAGKDYTPSFNIAPTDVTPVIVSSSRFPNVAQSDRVLKPMMWGIIPPWHKGDYKTHHLSTNNCRLENIKSSKLYSPILNNGGRCIIVAEGFYEWQTTNKMSKVKQPYYIYAPQDNGIKTIPLTSSLFDEPYVGCSIVLIIVCIWDSEPVNENSMVPTLRQREFFRETHPHEFQTDEPDTWNNNFNKETGWTGIRLLQMAGLYHVWQNEDTIIYSYSVITMESNHTLDWLHHRMPAVLDSDEQIKAWLDIDNVKPDMALTYLKPVTLLSWHQVSIAVNNSRNKSANCNKRLPEEKNKKSVQKTLNSWFVKVEKRKLNEKSEPEPKKQKK